MHDKQGPLTAEEFRSIWRAATDPSYHEAIEAAGDGAGLEVYGQAFAQFEAVSTSIDVTTQACFILPWSGQTRPPAGGPAKARVDITFTRTRWIDQPLRLTAGLVWVEELTTDAGDNGAVPVLTGRRYAPVEDVLFYPGDPGPRVVACEAELPGYGHNFPLPGTLARVSQAGAGLSHDRATVALGGFPLGNLSDWPATSLYAPPTSDPVRIIAVNEADAFVSEHVGQVVCLTDGANRGQVAGVVDFAGADPARGIGSAVTLERLGAFSSPSTGLLTVPPGTLVVVYDGAAADAVHGWARYVAGEAIAGGARYLLAFTNGGFAPTATTDLNVATSLYETAVAVGAVLYDPVIVAEVGAASWRILDWAGDLGLATTNLASPVGGVLGILDEIGSERGIRRGPGEDDETYRRGVHRVSDVVSPNAIRRAIVKAAGGLPISLREVGTQELPGVYLDAGDAFDSDVLILTTIEAVGAFVNPALPGGYQEAVELRNAVGDVLCRGWFGRIDGATLTFIRRQEIGIGSAAYPYVPAAGDYVIGLSSTAIFTVATSVANPDAQARRFHLLFDYTDFRAFFLLGVPHLGLGEFGFAYDVGAQGAYDSSPLVTFYDGFPAGNAATHQRLVDGVSRARAGGVGVGMYQEEGAPG